MSSQRTRRKISPRYRPAIIFSNDWYRINYERNEVQVRTCSPGLFDASSMMMSYFVRASSNQQDSHSTGQTHEDAGAQMNRKPPIRTTSVSKLPHHPLTPLTLIAIPWCAGNPTAAIFGIFPAVSMYAALHPVPKMTAILVLGST